MHLYTRIALVLLVSGFISSAHARDDRVMLSIADALNSQIAQEKLGDDVKLFFGDQPHPPATANLGNFESNQKTNGFARDKVVACQRAFTSAMISFQNRARSMGAGAVVNITSFYKQEHVSSPAEFMCGQGNTMVGVTFKGDVVKLM
ncbi:MAG: hypothetical protein O3A63_12210 [Proteobacteria bacterium]|nr:hypothetical protein [Pseudomonadota bacterium]